MNKDNKILDYFMGSCSHVAIVNFKTKTIRFLKSTLGNTTIEEAYDAEFVVTQALQSVYEDDKKLFRRTLNIHELYQNAIHGHNGLLLSFRAFFGSSYKWLNAMISTPDTFSDENPEIMIYSVPIQTQNEIILDAHYAAEAEFHKYLKVNILTGQVFSYHITDMDSHTYEQEISKKYEESYLHTKLHYVHPEDLNIYESYLNPDNLRTHFSAEETNIQLYYRRLVSNSYRWVKTIVTPAVEFTPENPVVILLINDINNEALPFLSDLANYQFERFNSRKEYGITEHNYTNLLDLLKVFTEPYLFYIMIDLQQDSYLSYKTGNPFHRPNGDMGGKYSTMIERHVRSKYPADRAESILKFASRENILVELQDKLTITYRFTPDDGKPIVCTIAKLEGYGTTTTRVVCFGLPDTECQHLLTVKTFGNFEVIGEDGKPIRFEKKQSKQVFAFLIDRKGYPVTINDIVLEVLEKPVSDLNAKKYASALLRKAMKDLEAAGYPDVIVETNHTYSVNRDAVDCDYYHLVNGNVTYWAKYHNEYMSEYSWAEETNASLLYSYEIRQ